MEFTSLLSTNLELKLEAAAQTIHLHQHRSQRRFKRSVLWCVSSTIQAAHCHWMTWTVLHLRIENRLAQVALSRFRLHTGAALQNFVVPQRLMGHFARIYSNIYFRDQQSVSYSFLESRIYRPGCNESSPSNQFNHSILVRW